MGRARRGCDSNLSIIMALVTATFCHQVGHLTARFLPSEVRILKFCAADVSTKRGEKHWNEGFVHVF